MDPYRQNGKKENKKMEDGTSNSNTEGRWGTWVMGSPVPPQAHPANQQAATWVGREVIPSSDPATSNANYMKYSVPPVTNGSFGGGGRGSGGGSMPQPTNPYIQTSSVSGSSGNSPTILKAFGRLGRKFEDCARKAEGFTENCWHHLKTSPSVTDAAMARLAQGTKVLAEGGHEKVFQQTFQLLPEEKLLKEYACYLSTSSGPVIGTLYISTKRVAFCSDNPLCYYPAPGHQEWLYYKVSVPLDQLVVVNPSSNRLNPYEKYIELVMADGHEFWFMGFVSYDKALKNLTEALHCHGAFSRGIPQSTYRAC